MKSWKRMAGSGRCAMLMLAAAMFAAWCGVSPAAEAQRPVALRVGIYDVPPFATRDADGNWRGLSVALWEEIATKLGVAFAYEETPLDQMFERLGEGSLDVAIGELGVTAERERVVDFTQPYLAYPLAAAMPESKAFPHWIEFVWDLPRHGLFQVLGVMFGGMILTSIALWLIERRAERSHFGGRAHEGFGSAVWFSAVTMTTVGYGDKTPKTLAGRAVAFLWMFFGVLLIAAFTATVASSVAMSRMQSTVKDLEDLRRVRNGVTAGSLAQPVLEHAGIVPARFESVEAGLAALKEGSIGAFVGDAVALRYLSGRDYPGAFTVLPLPTTKTHYAFALRQPLPEREAINVTLIEIVNTPNWRTVLQRWLGPEMLENLTH
jgi:polar amino acid transport system substrate-binding protein